MHLLGDSESQSFATLPEVSHSMHRTDVDSVFVALLREVSWGESWRRLANQSYPRILGLYIDFDSIIIAVVVSFFFAWLDPFGSSVLFQISSCPG